MALPYDLFNVQHPFRGTQHFCEGWDKDKRSHAGDDGRDGVLRVRGWEELPELEKLGIAFRVNARKDLFSRPVFVHQKVVDVEVALALRRQERVDHKAENGRPAVALLLGEELHEGLHEIPCDPFGVPVRFPTTSRLGEADGDALK